MRKWRILSIFLRLVVISIMLASGPIGRAQADDGLTLADLARQTHFHGIAVNPHNPSQLFLATHHGFFMVSSDGAATRLSDNRDDFMGFTPHPSDPSVLYASGHPARGGNLGFITSRDGGKTWQQVSTAIGGPVDFHQMAVSVTDPNRIYGAYAGRLQVSRDGGRNWAIVGSAPAGLLDLAVSANSADKLYAATQAGLMLSQDGGVSWQDAVAPRGPATMVETTQDGRLYAFIAGTGLIGATETKPNWQVLARQKSDQVLLHVAADPTNSAKLYAVPNQGSILASLDGGKTWTPFRGAAQTERK